MKSESDILEEQLLWHRRAGQGCAYAAFLANTTRQQSAIWNKVLIGTGIDQNLIREVQLKFDEACLDESNQVLSIIIPVIQSEDDLKSFITVLYKHYPGVSIDCEYQKRMDCTLIRIKFPLANDQGKLAWVLGFISIDISPLTRRSPHTELVIATKSKQFFYTKFNRHSLYKPNADSISRNEDESSVHLADIVIDNITEITKEDNKFWKASKDMKIAKLENKLDDRAKGKVSFTVSGEFYPV
jgi:hypothetical protein